MTADETTTDATPRGPGRPKIGSPIFVRVYDDQRAAIDRWQAEHGVKVQADAIRELIDRGLAAGD